MKIFRLRFRAEWNVLGGTAESQAAEMVIRPGDREGGPRNKHDGDQWLFVVSGRGRAKINAKTVALAPDTLVLIKAGEKHEIIATGRAPLRTLNFYAPPVYRKK